MLQLDPNITTQEISSSLFYTGGHPLSLQVVEKKLSVELCGVRYYHKHGKNITMIAAGCPKLTNQHVL